MFTAGINHNGSHEKTLVFFNMPTTLKVSSVIDKTLAFCNEIASLFEVNEKEKIPNFIFYCSKTSKTRAALSSWTFLYRINERFPKKVFDFMSAKRVQNLRETSSSGKKRAQRSLDFFFEKEAKEKFLITFSSLIAVYLDAHKMFRLYDYKPCNESYLLEYIDVLAEEMLNPNYINLEGSKRKGMKLLPAKKIDTTCENSDNLEGNKRKSIKLISTKKINTIGKNSAKLKGSKRKRMKLIPSKKIDTICENNGPISSPPPPLNNI